MPGCETGTGAYAQNGESSSLNCCRRLTVRFPFRTPQPQLAAAHLPRDCCSNSWSTQKLSRKATSAMFWASSSIPFFAETQLDPCRFERICNEIVDSGIELTCTSIRGKILQD